MIKNQKENELLIKKQKEQDQLYLRQPLNRTQQQIIYPTQVQQKKYLIPKNSKPTNIPNNNYMKNPFDEIPKMPRDSKRSNQGQNDSKQNSNLPKVESGSSYQLLGKGILNLNDGTDINYNNIDIYENKNYTNTNYEIYAPNMNDIGYNQQYNIFDNEINNIGYK